MFSKINQPLKKYVGVIKNFCQYKSLRG